MNKYKYLAKNIGALTISNFGTRILVFFLVPIYTSILSTEEYGIYDFFSTTIGVMLPILTLNIMVAVMRFMLDESADEKVVFTVGIKYLLIGSGIVAIFILVNNYFDLIAAIKAYSVFFLLMFVSQACSEITISFARGKNQVVDVAIAGIISSLVMIGGNVYCLCVIKIGLRGYFIANIIGYVVQAVYLFVRVKGWEKILFKIRFDMKEKEMLAYSKPMVLNSVAWWANSLFDRYVIIIFCGLSANGIYSMASKIPAILNVFQTIFNQAWAISAVKDFDKEDSSGFFSKVYNCYNCLMVIFCSGLIVINRFLAKIMFANEFYSAWKYVPFLLISIVFGAVSGYIEGIFIATKNVKICAKSTLIGAGISITLNLVTVPCVGALGAAFSTMISYFVIYLIRIKYLKKSINITLKYVRDSVAYILLLVQGLLFLVLGEENWILYGIQVGVFLGIVGLFYEEVNEVRKVLFRKIRILR